MSVRSDGYLQLHRHLLVGRGAAEAAFEDTLCRAELAAFLDGAADQRRALPQLVDHRAADTHGGIGRECRLPAVFKGARGLDQCDHADLDQVLDVDRGRNPRMDVPGNLADQSKMRRHQPFRIGRRRLRRCIGRGGVGRGGVGRQGGLGERDRKCEACVHLRLLWRGVSRRRWW